MAGAIAAIPLGLIAMAIGWHALAHSRRAEQTANRSNMSGSSDPPHKLAL
ncbi:DUF6223 family protein [Streptomyces sp. WM6386]|nr:DUF6223 family protein [Streptomyces sp. WM6386]